MARYVINPELKKAKIRKEIYGHFAEHLGRCIYEGIYVGEDSKIPNQDGMRKDVVEALKNIQIPVLRWPGGCFADEYHWKDGVGPKALRKRMINTHWGGDVEDNSFGTHEFMNLCDQLGCEAYVNGNVGSGTVVEMQEWVEYMTFDGVSPMAESRQNNGREEPWRVRYFGVGNENWGCGGNMRPEYYADLYRRFQTYVRSYGDNAIYKIACGANSFDYDWTEKVMEIAGKYMHGLSLHYYTVPGDWQAKGSAADFNTQDWYNTLNKTLKMEELVTKHGEIMDRFDPDKKVGMIVDEWGSWYDVEPGTNPGHLYQQNTMRDALIAGINLNIFNQHADRVHMANIAQTVNVLQAVILTQDEKMVLTPTYHVFDMYKVHQENELIESNLFEVANVGTDDAIVPMLHESASIDAEGRLHITLCNLSADETANLDVHIAGGHRSVESAFVLSGDIQAKNTFEEPEAVKPQAFSQVQVKQAEGGETGLSLQLPPASVVSLTLSKA